MEFTYRKTSDPRDDKGKPISFTSLEEFMKWVEQQGDVIVKHEQGKVELEIYDYWRE